MKDNVKFFLALLLIGFSSALAGQDFYGIDEAKEKKTADLIKSALSKSLEKMHASGQAVSDHKIVISEHRGFIVVSYIINDPRAYGGRMHSVYDPKSDRIVYVLGED